MSQPPPADGYPFGRPSYVPPPYGPPGGPPLDRPPRKGRRTAILAGLIGALVVLTIGLTGLDLAGRGTASSTSSRVPSAAAAPTTRSTAAPLRPYQPRSTTTSIPHATLPPDDLGSDPALDRLARRCFDGEMQACDDLFADAASNSLYETYGDSCAGRQEPGTDIYCTTAFPGS
jgi:hypothetical protein